jgi:hypothetical protein
MDIGVDRAFGRSRGIAFGHVRRTGDEAAHIGEIAFGVRQRTRHFLALRSDDLCTKVKIEEFARLDIARKRCGRAIAFCTVQVGRRFVGGAAGGQRQREGEGEYDSVHVRASFTSPLALLISKVAP